MVHSSKRDRHLDTPRTFAKVLSFALLGAALIAPSLSSLSARPAAAATPAAVPHPDPADVSPTSITTSLSGGGQSGTSISVPSGTAVTDSASLSGASVGTAGGTVTYNVYADDACTISVGSGGTVTVTDGTVPASDGVSLASAGTYYWQASYSGDALDGPSASDCSEVETVTVPPGTSTATTVYDAGEDTPWVGTEVTGASAFDTATVGTEAGGGAPAPTGTVTYSFFTNGTCDGTPSTTDTVTLADGAVPNSSATTALAAGSYSFASTYSGDSTYSSSTSSCEGFAVAQASPSIGTVVDDAANSSPWGADEVTGASAYDTATVSGVSGFTPTGTVTYDFYRNNRCRGEPRTTDTETLSGGTVPDSGPTAALRAGSYSFRAAYSGDGNYSSSTSSCEAFSVAKASPSTGTVVDDAANSSPWGADEVTGASAYDTATVSGVSGFALRGTVTYDFFTNGACSGPASTTDTVFVSGAFVPDSGTTSALGAGFYSFEARYSGNSNYSPSTSSCEAFAVAQAPPSTGTVVEDAANNAPWGGNEATGAAAYDTATVSGVSGFTPTGTLTYDFFTNGACSGSPSTTDTVSLSDGAVPDSTTTSALGAGPYSFEATYSGDGNYSSSTSSCEAFAVTMTEGSVSTVVYDAGQGTPWNGTEVTGASAYDTASVSGVSGFTPTGTLTYDLYDNGACSGEAARTQTVTLSGGAVPSSDATGALAPGSYAYEASYSGDDNYLPATGSCETFAVLESPAATATVVYDAGQGTPWNGTEVTGASAYDTASVSGVSGFTPTGTLTYDLYDNGACSGEAARTQTVTLSGSAVPDSSSTAPLAAGTYGFEAAYSGDMNYLASTSTCEEFFVAPAHAPMSTLVYDAAHRSPWNGTEVIGASAYDTATVTGITGFDPTGSVTYSLFGNRTCSGGATSTDTVTLTHGAVPNSRATGALTDGSYSFAAAYAGDSNYDSSASPCEPFSVIKAASSTATVVRNSATHRPWSRDEDQGASAYDTAKVTGVAGYTPTGTLTYSLFEDGSCAGKPASTQTVTLSSGRAPDSARTAGLSPAHYSYRAAYSGNADYLPSAGPCESFRALAVGYRLGASDGGVFDFHVPYLGSVPGLGRDLSNFVGMADSPKGYWLVESNGGIFRFGNAHFFGSLPQRGENVNDIVGMAATPNGRGYWMVGSDGAVYRFGDATSHGSLPGRGIHVSDIVAIVSPDGGGYWLVGANGIVYSFGDARYHGSCAQGASGCNGVSDIVGAANIGGSGYWLVSRNGRVFAFGTARVHGSCTRRGSGCRGATDIIGIASPDAGGYWLAEANGRVLRFGDAKFFGDEARKGLQRSIIAIA
ncbi:MAG: hypothetical protein ACLPTB_12680 [Acidimicrobiales bacterium]